MRTGLEDYLYNIVQAKKKISESVSFQNKKDFVFICLDSCRYDVFLSSEAPNMKKIGKLRKTHSFSCFTPGSIIGYFMNFPPMGLNIDRLYPYKKWSWLPRELKKDGYSTALLSPNAVIPLLDLNLNKIFSRYFDLFECLKFEGKTAVQEIVDESISFLKKNDLVFLFILLMETHTPIFDGKQEKTPFPVQRPQSIFNFQKKAVEFIDEKIMKLFEYLKTRRRNVDVIITSDHGELLGPLKWGHNPGDINFLQQSMIEFKEELFEIPFIRGQL